MKTLMLTEKDRGIIKVCANAERGKEEDLFAFLAVGTKLELSAVENELRACDGKVIEPYELEEAEFKLVEKLYKAMTDKGGWPYAWAEDVLAFKARLDAAKISKKAKTGKGKGTDL